METLRKEIDGKRVQLDVQKISYQDELYLKLDLKELEIKDTNTIDFIVKNIPIQYNFCKTISIEDNSLIVQAVPCKNKVDTLFDSISKNKTKDIKVELDGKVINTKIIDADDYYKSLVIEINGIKDIKKMSLSYNSIECANSMIDNFELEDNELIVNLSKIRQWLKSTKYFYQKYLKTI